MPDERTASNAAENSTEPTESAIAVPLADNELTENEERENRQSLYIIAESDMGPCKIGISNDIDRKLVEIQVGNPRTLEAVNYS